MAAHAANKPPRGDHTLGDVDDKRGYQTNLKKNSSRVTPRPPRVDLGLNLKWQHCVRFCHLLETAVICTRDSGATAVKFFIPPTRPTRRRLDWAYPRLTALPPFQTTSLSYYFLVYDPHGISHEQGGLESRELFERRYQTESSSYG